MFSVPASTMPAPATVLPNGVRAGSTGGGGFGGVCWARDDVNDGERQHAHRQHRQRTS